ncbi:MAG: hypothetical protein ACI9HE_001697 [Planctomycetota bacterium]
MIGLLGCMPVASGQGVVLSEFLAKNDSVMADEDGDFSDWIELHNPASSGTLDLGGWSLSDDSSDPTKWTFQTGTLLPAGDFLLVFASSKDRRDPIGILHTNFKLSGSGEYLGLVRPNGSVATDFAPGFPAQYDDVSFGLAFPLASAGQDAYFTSPTPGAANGGGGPVALDPGHTPHQPLDGDDLVVTVSVPVDLGPSGSVSLHWRVMYALGNNSPMLDDGVAPDVLAGDQIFSALIPANMSAPGEMLRYKVAVADSNGGVTTLPPFVSPLGSPEFLGTVVADPAVQSNLPVWEWFVQSPPAANTQQGTRCSLWIEGEFYDNVDVHVRGSSSLFYPRKSYKFDFNSAHRPPIDALGLEIDEANINTHWADKAHMRQVLSYDMYAALGCPGSKSWPLRMQQNGDFFSVQTFVEEPDRFLLERLGRDPNGALYKLYSMMNTVGGAEKITRTWEGNADLIALRNALSLGGPGMEAYLFDNLDVPEVLSYLVATWLIHDNDHVAKNYYLFRDSDGDGEWSFLPWDKDLTWGRNYSPSGGVLNDKLWSGHGDQSHIFFGDSAHPKIDGPWNRLINRVYGNPRLRAMYLRRLRTVCDEVLEVPGGAPGSYYLESIIEQWHTHMAADVVLDAARWGVPTWATPRSFLDAKDRMISNYVVKRRNHLYTKMTLAGGGELPDPEPIAGRLYFSASDVDPVSGNQAEEYLLLSNFSSFAMDLSGYQLQGGVQFTFPMGTVIEAGGKLFLSPDVASFRARATGPSGGQSLFVIGPYESLLTSPGSVQLFDAKGIMRSKANY